MNATTVEVTIHPDGTMRVTWPDRRPGASGTHRHVTLKPTSQRAAAIRRALEAVTDK